MAQEVFKRYEKKYLMTRRQQETFLEKASARLCMDQYGKHTICNIYLDTPDYQLIRTSLEKPVYKEKMRLRAYGPGAVDDSRVFLELKKKFQSVVYKRRAELSLKEGEDYILHGKKPEKQGQIFKELDYTKTRYGLIPAAYLSYERTAWICPHEPELRITFDQNVRGRTEELTLRSHPFGERVLKEDMVLMEMKAPGAIPLWLCRLLGECRIFPATFSKYGVYFMDCICRKPLQEGGISCA